MHYWNWVARIRLLYSNDADLELAVKAAVAGHYQNTGQVCAAVNVLCRKGIAQAFTDRFVAAAALKMGDPRLKNDTGADGAAFDLRDELHQRIAGFRRRRLTATVGRGENRRGGQLIMPRPFWRMSPDDGISSGARACCRHYRCKRCGARPRAGE